MKHRPKQLSMRLLALATLLAIAPMPAAWAKTPAPVAPVNLGAAGSFVILSQSGITDVPHSAVTGDVGASPISGTAILITCAEVTGNIYSVDTAGPLPCRKTNASKLGTAVGAMQTAYTDATSRHPTVTELGSGAIGGLTLTPGVYSWSSAVTIPTNVTLNGGGVYIFQIAQTLDIASAKAVILTGGALANDIFWQVGGVVTLGTTSHFEGNILAATNIAMQTGATINGRLLAQTAVTLDMNVVTEPPLTQRKH